MYALYMRIADIAQSVEHSLGKGEVTSSSLVIGTTPAANAGSGWGEALNCH